MDCAAGSPWSFEIDPVSHRTNTKGSGKEEKAIEGLRGKKNGRMTAIQKSELDLQQGLRELEEGGSSSGHF